MKKLCQFSTVWAVWAGQADFGSQNLISKLTSIFARKTHDNLKIDIQKITQIRQSLAPSFSNQKRDVGYS